MTKKQIRMRLHPNLSKEYIPKKGYFVRVFITIFRFQVLRQ